jgi:hypothetical protein
VADKRIPSALEAQKQTTPQIAALFGGALWPWGSRVQAYCTDIASGLVVVADASVICSTFTGGWSERSQPQAISTASASERKRAKPKRINISTTYVLINIEFKTSLLSGLMRGSGHQLVKKYVSQAMWHRMAYVLSRI